MSHLCFISTPAALRLSTSAPGNNYLAQAHPLTSWLGTRSARPGLCLLSAPSRQWTAPLSSLGCLSGARVTTVRGWGGPRDLGKDLLREDCLPGPTTLGEAGAGRGRGRRGRRPLGIGGGGEEKERERRGDAQAPCVGSISELRQVCRTQPGSQRLRVVGLQPMSPGVGGLGGALSDPRQRTRRGALGGVSSRFQEQP